MSLKALFIWQPEPQRPPTHPKGSFRYHSGLYLSSGRCHHVTYLSSGRYHYVIYLSSCRYDYVIYLSSGRYHYGIYLSPIQLDPQCTSSKGLMVSIRWYLGCLKGQLGGAGNYCHIMASWSMYVREGCLDTPDETRLTHNSILKNTLMGPPTTPSIAVLWDPRQKANRLYIRSLDFALAQVSYSLQSLQSSLWIVRSYNGWTWDSIKRLHSWPH